MPAGFIERWWVLLRSVPGSCLPSSESARARCRVNTAPGRLSATTLKAWADKYGWREKREEIAQAESEIRTKTILGRKAVLERLIEATDGKEASQVAFAVASLEGLALKQQEMAASGKIPSVHTDAAPVITTHAEAVAALRQAVEKQAWSGLG